jgi:hypothetical protein
MKTFFISAILFFFASNANSQNLKNLVNRDMIGVNRLYFEKFIGVPKYVEKNSYRYSFNRCEIFITTDKNNSILSLGLREISKNCTVNVSESGFGFSNKNLKDIKLKDILDAAYEWDVENDSCLSTRGTGQIILENKFVIRAAMPRAIGSVQVRVETWGKGAAEVAGIIENMYPNTELCLYGDLNKELEIPVLKKLIEKEMLGGKITSIQFFY